MTSKSTSGRLGPSVGLNVLHLFCRVGRDLDIQGWLQATKEARSAGAQVVTAAIVGHKADLCFMMLGEDLQQLRKSQSALQSAGLEVVSSYVSLTEVSEYAKGLPEEMLQARLHPKLPPEGKPAFCFYPMSKRRGDRHNWYALGYDERKQLMLGHGVVGRRFAGRVLQIVTASMGLDDYEWGVTLFAQRPDDLKQCVYEMRFDEASARYAEFGPFYSGFVGEIEEILAAVSPNTP